MSDDGEKWAAWLGKHVAARGAGGRVTPASLRKSLQDKGFDVVPSTVGRWLTGTRAGSADIAGAVGDVFGDRAGALRAAGYVDPDLGTIAVYSGEASDGVTIIVLDNAKDYSGMTVAELMKRAGIPQ